MSAYQKLVDRFVELHHLNHAMTFLSWDQMVMMPSNGNDSRSAAMAEIASIHHAKLTAPEVGDWLEDAAAVTDAEQRLSVREMRRVWQRSACLPAELVKAKVIAGSRCEHGWRSQRGENDWSGFLANFREVVTLSREEAQRRQSVDASRFATPYDSLLDLHCVGDSKQLIDEVFTVLRAELPSLLQEVTEKQRSSDSPQLTGVYPVEQQQALSRELMVKLGFDFDSGRLDQSMHPFSTGVPGDLRITTRYSEDEFHEALSATAHEVGHSSYEGGLPEQWQGLPLGSHRNMCIHESQSLLFEKQLFLSKPFTEHFTDTLHRHLPSSAAFDSDRLWRAATRVKPGYIRVEADEVSYPLHVLLRYEIESSLINGEIEAEDIPGLWNEKMVSYLGLSTDGDYVNGCMQDIHWTDGAFGYFPSYTLGAVNAAQLFASLCADNPDWQSSLLNGETGFAREWLKENIWSQGCALESQELMTQSTGAGTDPSFYIKHLRDRYLDGVY